jgi:hypothetical protein
MSAANPQPSLLDPTPEMTNPTVSTADWHGIEPELRRKFPACTSDDANFRRFLGVMTSPIRIGIDNRAV